MRKRLSGTDYKKQSKIKLEKEQKLLQQWPHISEWWVIKSTLNSLIETETESYRGSTRIVVTRGEPVVRCTQCNCAKSGEPNAWTLWRWYGWSCCSCKTRHTLVWGGGATTGSPCGTTLVSCSTHRCVNGFPQKTNRNAPIPKLQGRVAVEAEFVHCYKYSVFGSANYHVYQKACHTGLPNISSTVCISIRTQSRRELSTDLTGMS